MVNFNEPHWTNLVPPENDIGAWWFNFSDGEQSAGIQRNEYKAVAVRDGDVWDALQVPEPQTLALSLLALSAAAMATQRKNP